jgi:23S rRNA pseudouridine1911/1915/1917 synthase
MASIGHPVVGDTLYGAAGQLTAHSSGEGLQSKTKETLRLGRNFLHAAELEFSHPITEKPLALKSALPAALEDFLSRLESEPQAVYDGRTSKE